MSQTTENSFNLQQFLTEPIIRFAVTKYLLDNTAKCHLYLYICTVIGVCDNIGCGKVLIITIKAVLALDIILTVSLILFTR